MTRSRIAVGLLLLAAIVGVWLFEPFAPASPAGLSTATAGPSRIGTPERLTDATQPPTTASRDAVATSADDGARLAAQRVRIEVVTATGDPAPGAEVRYWPPRNQSESASDEQLRSEHHDLEQALRAAGRVALTDAQGVVEIDAEALSEVGARLGDLYGEAMLPSHEPGSAVRVRIGLVRDVSLQVEVADLAGTPYPNIEIQVESQLAMRRRGLTDHQWQLQTNDRGLAEQAHLQSFLGCEAELLEGALTVRCYRLTKDDDDRVVLAEQTVAWSRLQQDGRVRLLVPTGGTIAVRVTNLDGIALDADATLLDARGEVFARSAEDGDFDSFHLVPLGRSWTVHVKYGELDQQLVVSGPSRAGEVVRVDVPWAKHGWHFRGQVVRSDRLPFDDVHMNLTLRCPSVQAGEMEWNVPMDEPFDLWIEGNVDVARRIELQVAPAINAFAEAKTFVFDREMPHGDVDLGELVLPVANDLVTLATVEVRGGDRVVTPQTRILIREAGETLKVLPTPRGASVEIRGLRPKRPLTLFCKHPEYGASDPKLIELGEHCLIEFQPAAWLQVAVLPPEVPVSAVWADLEPLDARQQSGGGTLCSEGLHDLLWTGLAPGRYRLCIGIKDQVLHEESEVMLALGSNRWPPDGRRIDLRNKVRACWLIARDAIDPTKRVYPDVLQLPSGATSLPEDPDTSSWFLPKRDPADLLVTAEGYLPVRVSNPVTDVRLRMQRMTKLTVSLGDREREGGRILVRMLSDGVTDRLLRLRDNDHQHGPEAKCWFDHPELYYAPGTELEISLTTGPEPRPSKRVTVGDRSPQAVELR